MSRIAASAFQIAMLMLLGFCGTGCSLVRDANAVTRETHREQSIPLTAFLNEGRATSGLVGSVALELPIRIGIAFLPPIGSRSGALPTAPERRAALTGVRDAMLTMSYVSEVVIVPDYYLRAGAGGGFEKLQELARRFDFDLTAVIACEQTSYETRNFRSLGLITVLGADLWEGDVDEARTVIDLVIVEPESRSSVMRVTSAAEFGDTTTLLDDWRSGDHVRRVSFDEARAVLISELQKQLGGLRSRIQPAADLHP